MADKGSIELRRNRCNCHPETCGCQRYSLDWVSFNGKKKQHLGKFYSLQEAQQVKDFLEEMILK